MSHRPSVTVAFSLLLAAAASSEGCGSPKPAAPLAANVSSKGDPNRPPSGAAAGRRAPSSDLVRRWPFEHTPQNVAYVDLRGLLKTELFRAVVPTLLRMGKNALTDAQTTCLDGVVAGAKELLVGDDDEAGDLFVATLDPASLKPSLTACLETIPNAKPTSVPGAEQAFELDAHVFAVTSGTVMAGPRELVVEALARSATAANRALPDLTLGPDQYVSWKVDDQEQGIHAHGGLIASNERVRLDFEIDLPEVDLAEELERETAVMHTLPQLLGSGGNTEGAELGARLAKSFEIKRSGKHVGMALDVREPPAEQARDVGALASLAVDGVQQYLVRAKTAEAKNTVTHIAKALMAWWDAEDKAGPARAKNAKKKLFSLPAVPKTVPRGQKYQSSSADWTPWSKIHFEMSSPQYFQYEVRAAKDGESAEVIAHGDLDGDGKTSTFKVMLRVQRGASSADDRLVATPEITEQDPEE